ncbi:MAG: HlyD family efflux transporter periplasmic adaptor subunit [Bacteroidales bacterium]
MSEENIKIELKSDDVEDILGKVPGWLTRNGIFMLLILISILILGAWTIKIPDVKKADIYVTSRIPPADIQSRSDGKIDQLMVSDNERVNKGQVLAVIENPANYDDVMALHRRLNGITITNEKIYDLELPAGNHSNLGMIQQDYASFYKNLMACREFVSLNYHNRKIAALKQKYDQYINYSVHLDTRASTLKEEDELTEKQFLRDSMLYLQGVVSESDFESSKSRLLAKRAAWQAMLSLKAENQINAAGIHEQMLEMELKREEQYTELFSTMEESLNRLRATIAAWEKKYLIIAPINGHATFNRIWSVNQNINQGEKVMTIIPMDQEGLIGKILLPIRGAGEVREGHQVNIRFANFPYLEYGMVKGEVSNVSKVPHDDFYSVEVNLPDGLTTYYGIEINFDQNMQGQAEILTDKLRLLKRIFNPVRSAVSRQREM